MQLFRTLTIRWPTAGSIEESQRDIDPILDHAGSGVARERSSLVVGRVGSSVVLRSLDRPLSHGESDRWKGKLGSVRR